MASETLHAHRTPDNVPVLYGASWCDDCRRAKRVLDGLMIAYRYVDIEDDREAHRFLQTLMTPMRLPTIVCPDGRVLIDPNSEVLASVLG